MQPPKSGKIATTLNTRLYHHATHAHMETSPPSLADLYALKTVEGVAFWCSNHACQHHDSAPVGVLAIDYGPGLTLPDMERFSYCLECYGPVQVRPAWKAMSKSLVGT